MRSVDLASIFAMMRPCKSLGSLYEDLGWVHWNIDHRLFRCFTDLKSVSEWCDFVVLSFKFNALQFLIWFS